MNGLRRRCPVWGCSLVLLCAVGGTAHGQNNWIQKLAFWDEPAESHAEIVVAPKSLGEFQQRVLMAELRNDPGKLLQNEQLRRRLQEIIEGKEFQQLHLDPAQQQQIDTLKGFLRSSEADRGQPPVRRALDGLIPKAFKENNPALAESIRKILDFAGKANQTPQKAGDGEGSSGDVPVAAPGNSGIEPEVPESGDPKSGEFERWLLRQTEWLGQWSERFGHSPAFQQALRSARLGGPNAEWQKRAAATRETYLGKQLFQLARRLHPEKLLDRLNQSAREHFEDASFGRRRLPRLGVPWGNLPSVSMPTFGTGSAGGPGADTSLVWLLVAAVSAQVLWFVHHKRKQARAARGPAPANRAWPVLPAAVCSRDDLIKAFEYLSVLKLGPEARTWNHLDIAAALGDGGPERHVAAGRLAAVYEQARYTPEDEPLGAESLASARGALSYLAGVPVA